MPLYDLILTDPRSNLYYISIFRYETYEIEEEEVGRRVEKCDVRNAYFFFLKNDYVSGNESNFLGADDAFISRVVGRKFSRKRGGYKKTGRGRGHVPKYA